MGSGATGTITVTTPGGTATSSGSFTFTRPDHHRLHPEHGGIGHGGDHHRHELHRSDRGDLRRHAAASFTVISATTITATVGSGATGNVTAINQNGYGVSAGIFTVVTPLVSVAFQATPVAPVPTGTPVQLLATATGGAFVQFQFWCYNPAATPCWCQLQAYSSTATCVWTPSYPAITCSPSPRNMALSGREVNTTAWYQVNSSNPLTGVSFTASPALPRPPNTLITFTAMAKGGSNVQYTFWLYNPTGTPAWSQLQGYAASATCPWQPAAPGNYFISVTAQDGLTGTEVNSCAWYGVCSTTPLTALASLPRLPPRSRTAASITLTAAATGGADILYQFWVYNPLLTPAWQQLQAYSPQAACTWTPATRRLPALHHRDGRGDGQGSEHYAAVYHQVRG